MRADLAVLTDRGVIEVSGLEAREFLQRLVTNDVIALAAGQARYAALLSPQGKIVTDFFMVACTGEREDMVLLDVPESRVDDLAKKLTMYRLRAKVAIENRTPALRVVAFAPGVQPEGALQSYADPRGGTLWHRAIVPADRVDHCDDAGRWAYREQRIRAGVPEGGLDFTYGDTFPHEANLDRLHGIDFKKGCYVGQEVVSRVEHRGTARKRIVSIAFEGEAPPVGIDILADGLAIGTMGSSIEGLGLGQIRLDRVEEARHEHGRVMAGGVPLRLVGPGWGTGQADPGAVK